MKSIPVRSTLSFGHPLVLIVLAMLGLDSLAQTSESERREELLIRRETVQLPGFDEISGRPMIDRYTDAADYERARSDNNYRLERLTYRSDGLEVVAYLFRPKYIDAPQPTIVFNRGSYVRDDTAPEYLTMFYRLAETGFVVLAPMYRGSEGASGTDEMGGDDLNDLLRTAGIAEELPSVDTDRLFLLGESRGGMMVLQAIRDGFPARAAAIYGAPTDFFRLFEESPAQYEGIADRIWPDWRSNSDRILGRRSAITWAERIDTPLLIMHGGNDRSMPVNQSLALAHRLQELGKIYELHIFGYENHMISGQSVERDAITTAWFDRHRGE